MSSTRRLCQVIKYIDACRQHRGLEELLTLSQVARTGAADEYRVSRRGFAIIPPVKRIVEENNWIIQIFEICMLLT